MSKRKFRLGDRRDGHRVRTLPPMQYVAVSIMNKRDDAQNYFQSSVDYGNIEEYIHQKREEGLAGFGFLHVLVASFVRTASQKPALNRYVSGLRIFTRYEIILNMMVKKEMKLNAQESAIKVRFAKTDTVYDVYNKMEAAIAKARETGDTTKLDTVARAVNYMPALLLRGFIKLMNLLDFFGLMPKKIEEASPFHGSLFVSNLGSLGIQPIYHHLYNFGNVPIFITFGAKYRKTVINNDGEPEIKNLVDYTVVMDERITDGHYLASALKLMEKTMNAPQRLDNPPEEVIEDID